MEASPKKTSQQRLQGIRARLDRWSSFQTALAKRERARLEFWEATEEIKGLLAKTSNESLQAQLDLLEKTFQLNLDVPAPLPRETKAPARVVASPKLPPPDDRAEPPEEGKKKRKRKRKKKSGEKRAKQELEPETPEKPVEIEKMSQ